MAFTRGCLAAYVFKACLLVTCYYVSYSWSYVSSLSTAFTFVISFFFFLILSAVVTDFLVTYTSENPGRTLARCRGMEEQKIIVLL